MIPLAGLVRGNIVSALLNALGDPGNIDLGSFRGDEVEIGTIAAFKRPPQNIDFGRMEKTVSKEKLILRTRYCSFKKSATMATV